MSIVGQYKPLTHQTTEPESANAGLANAGLANAGLANAGLAHRGSDSGGRRRGVLSGAAALLAVVMALTSVAFVFQPAPSDAEPAHDDQIVRLYITALGRRPDITGLAYWTGRRLAGESLVELAREMLTMPEAVAVSSGDPIVDAYQNAFGRNPEPEGYAHWSAYNDPAQAVAYIADSEELRILTGTLAPPANQILGPSASFPGTEVASVVVPAHWVDTGNGVMVPPILLAIRRCESTNNYTAANRRSSARGAYQFLKSSWAAYGHNERYGVQTADQAAPAQQDEAALLTWQRDGTRPWYASRRCWG